MKPGNLALALGFLLLLHGQLLSADKLTVGTSPRLDPKKFLPVIAAEEQRFWVQQGIEAKWIPFENSVAMAKAAATGDIHMGIHSVAGITQAVARKVPIIGVARLAAADAFYIWVP